MEYSKDGKIDSKVCDDDYEIWRGVFVVCHKPKVLFAQKVIVDIPKIKWTK